MVLYMQFLLDHLILLDHLTKKLNDIA